MLLSCVEFTPTDPEGVFRSVHTHVINPGIGNYQEFPTERLQAISGTEFKNVNDSLNRGCYGYVSFGFESGLIDQIRGQYLYYPPDYINYDHQVFAPPSGTIGYACRIWIRKGVQLLINWAEDSPLSTGATLMLPGEAPRLFPDPATGKFQIKGSSEVNLGGVIQVRGNASVELR